MKIAIDFDGTATRHVKLFAEIMKALQKEGHEVGVLTGRDNACAETDIKFLLTYGFPQPSFYIGKDTKERGIPQKLWKNYMMCKYSIDYLFDNWDTSDIFLNDRPKE